MTIDLVVSAYKDDLSWVEGLCEKHPEVRLFVYDKSGAAGGVPVGFRPPPRFLQNHFDPQPNVGKCDHSYLHHIIEHYGSLAAWTVFSTDYPFDGLPAGRTMEGALISGEDVVCPFVSRVRDWGSDGRIRWEAMTDRSDRNGTTWAARWAAGKIARAELSFVEWAKQYVGFDPSGEWPGYHPGSVYG